jgi:hypothetical protein
MCAASSPFELAARRSSPSMAHRKHFDRVVEDIDARDLIDDLTVRVRRQAIVIERLGTEVHAILMVLLQKKLLTLDEVHGAERRLDLAAEIGKAREISAAAQAFEDLDRELGGASEAA